MKDLVIIGAGPAGLTAAIYGIRAGLDLLVIEKLSPGGQVVNSYEVENYPGFAEPIEGWKLMADMEQQARRLGVEIGSGVVEQIIKKDKFFIIRTSTEEIESRSVIVAAGSSTKKLGVPGEKEYTGRGVSYCATCDGAFFKDKTTVVVGGGDVALEEADFLTRFSKKVYLIHRRDKFRGAALLQKRVLNNEKIAVIYNSVVNSINGDSQVKSVTLKDVVSGASSELETDGVFIFVGYDPNTGFIDGELLNEAREIKVDMNMKTGQDGLFAAGDIRSDSWRQIVMAASDGATAALGVYEYIVSLNEEKII